MGPAPEVIALESDEKVTVTLYPGCPVSYIDYRIEDLTAEAGKDYVRVSGRLLTAPWRFDIPILEDGVPEPDEVARVIISGPSTGAPGNAGGSCVGHAQSKTGSLTILQNDDYGTRSAQTNSASVERPTAVQAGPEGAASGSGPSPQQPVSEEAASDGSITRGATDLPMAGKAQRPKDPQDRHSPSVKAAIIGGFLILAVFAVEFLRRRRAPEIGAGPD